MKKLLASYVILFISLLILYKFINSINLVNNFIYSNDMMIANPTTAVSRDIKDANSRKNIISPTEQASFGGNQNPKLKIKYPSLIQYPHSSVYPPYRSLLSVIQDWYNLK